eukprot:4671054-Pyramimonas_sp.AAC.1
MGRRWGRQALLLADVQGQLRRLVAQLLQLFAEAGVVHPQDVPLWPRHGKAAPWTQRQQAKRLGHVFIIDVPVRGEHHEAEVLNVRQHDPLVPVVIAR